LRTNTFGISRSIGIEFIIVVSAIAMWQLAKDYAEVILRLKGEVDGINKGKGVDSFERYIYIHGTNKEELVGVKNFSHGCILMKNDDIIKLFDRVEEGTVVLID
jgi:hypothetical protein